MIKNLVGLALALCPEWFGEAYWRWRWVRLAAWHHRKLARERMALADTLHDLDERTKRD